MLEIGYLLLALDPHVLHPLLYVLALVGAALLALLQPGRRVHHLHGRDGNATALSGQRIWGRGLKPAGGSPHRHRWQLGTARAGHRVPGAVPSPCGTTVPSLPGQPTVANSRGHQLHVPKEPSPGSALARKPGRTQRQPPLQCKRGVRGRHGTHRETEGRGRASPPGQGCTAKRKEKRRRQTEADSRWKRRQWEYGGFY